ncbi:MAG: gliding motility-associated C-terminal domain-containing protein [Bacteroidota bacterium]
MKKVLILIAILWSIQPSFAKHIVGGAFSLKHINGNNYSLTLKVLRDCFGGGAPFDQPAVVGVFDLKTNALIETYELNLKSEDKLDFAGSNCNNGIPNTCTTLGLYNLNILMTPAKFNNNTGYYFVYQRCCRNNIITNIQTPEDAGIAIYMEIPPPRNIINSTPYFNANPNTYLCVGNLTKYNLNFKDDDGDQLVYSFVNPLNGTLTPNHVAIDVDNGDEPVEGPYPDVIWFGGHNTNEQILGTPSLSVDASTGELSVSPIQAGVYVTAIKVEEFRQGIKIGEVRLELQFNVTDCPQPLPQIVLKDTNGMFIGNTVTIQTPNIGCFDIEGSDITDSVFMIVKNISSDTNITFKPVFTKVKSDFRKVINRVCWEAACNLPEGKTQQLRVELVDNGCPFPTRSVLTINIKTIPLPTVNQTDMLCMTLIDDKATQFYWGDSTGNHPYFHKYNIYRAINSDPFLLLDSVLDKNLRSYTDPNTPMYSLNNYRYFMRAVNQCGKEGPSSDTLGTFEQLKYIPDQQKLITATVFEKNKVLITWPKSYEKDFARYMVYKTEASTNNYQLIKTYTTITDTLLIDEDVDVNQYSYCYHVIMKDTCDNYGPKGLEACTILLKGNSIPFKHTLNWTPYDYWESGTANYDIIRQGNESPVITGMLANPEAIDFLDDQLDVKSGIFSYSVIANQLPDPNYFTGFIRTDCGNAQSQSNTIELLQKPLVFIPNAFTPNGDGTNELWNIRDLYVKDYNLVVYNKWGQLIFTSNNKNVKWTGISENGDPEPTDVYIYRLVYTGYDESRAVLQGNITILR